MNGVPTIRPVLGDFLADEPDPVLEGRFDVVVANAAGLWDGFSAPRAAICRWAAAESLRRAGDADAAIEALGAAKVSAGAIGLQPLITRIDRSLRLAGVGVAARRAPGAAIDLSRRETEVVALVEEGLNNVEIARRLGLGRPTGARMLASAMGKLGVERRAQLAARELV